MSRASVIEFYRRAVLGHAQACDPQPEPSCADDTHLAEEAAVAADLQRNHRKAERAHERNDAHAMDLQIQMQGYVGALPR